MQHVYEIQQNEINLINKSVAKLEMYYETKENREFIDITIEPEQDIGSVDYYKQQIVHSALQKLGYTYYTNPYYDTKSLFNLASFLDAVWAGDIEYVVKNASLIYDAVSAPKYDTPTEEIKSGLKDLLTFVDEYAKKVHFKRHAIERR